MNRLPLLAFALLFMSCSHVISEQTLKTTDTSISFTQVKENADLYIGKIILVGGKIAGIQNGDKGGQLEIVEFNLDRLGFPVELSNSAGRFIATSPDFLDPLVYEKGKLVTIAGEVKGKKVGRLDGATYNYPLIGIKEIFAWKKIETEDGRTSPSPAFYNNYNPYDFGHDIPLWYRPTGPVIDRN